MPKPSESPVQLAGRITDARGREVSQLDPVMMHLLHRPGVIPPDVLRDIARELGFGLAKVKRITVWANVAGIACLGIALAICFTRVARGSLGVREMFLRLIPFIAVLTATFGTWVAARNVRHKRIGKVMLKHLRCPHCGYDIRRLPIDPEDGATVCPECGCAWKLNDFSGTADGGNGG